MSTNSLEVDAFTRSDFGKGASRRLRRENQVPAILYGGEGEPEPIMIKHNEVQKHLSNEAFYSQILMVSVDGKERVRALLRDVQRHPFKQQVLHLDMQRIVAGAELTVSVPLHFINEDTCIGVKAGGIVNHTENELSVMCRPRDIPENIEVDVGNLDIGDSIHISALTLPEGVRSTDLTQGDENDRVVASVYQPRIVVEDEEVEEAEAEATDEDAAEGSTEEDKDKDQDKESKNKSDEEK